MQLFGFLFVWRIAEGRRKGVAEEAPRDASLEKVLAESAVNLMPALDARSWDLLLLIGFLI